MLENTFWINIVNPFSCNSNGSKKWTELNKLNVRENSKAPSYPKTCINIFFFDRIQIRIELNKMNELNELKYWKAPS